MKIGLTECAQLGFFRYMKKILSLLMCYVFLQAESFALRGGPTSTGGAKVQGAYSGVLVENDNLGNDLGIFLLSANPNGASSGQIVIFSQTNSTAGGPGIPAVGNGGESDIYSGTITGLSDTSRGGTGKFYGIFTGNASTGSGTQRGISGQMTVTATKNAGGGNTQRLTGTGSSRTSAVNSVTNTSTVGAAKSYSIDGWLTSLDSAGAGFTVSN
jgi:hypothetical protein